VLLYACETAVSSASVAGGGGDGGSGSMTATKCLEMAKMCEVDLLSCVFQRELGTGNRTEEFRSRIPQECSTSPIVQRSLLRNCISLDNVRDYQEFDPCDAWKAWDEVSHTQYCQKGSRDVFRVRKDGDGSEENHAQKYAYT